MPIPPNTYVVLDIPSPFAEQVLELRRRHGDAFRYSLPAETTVSGSSGTGPFAPDESLERVTAVLDRIASETSPIRASFGAVRRFPSTDTFYLSFADEAPLRALHQRIATSGLRFQPNPYPFGPHCTIRTHAPVPADEAEAIGAVRVEGEFVLDTMSLYDLPPETDHRWPPGRLAFATSLCLLHRARLSGELARERLP